MIKSPGLPPGSLVYTGTKKIDSPVISVYRYNSDTVETKVLKTKEELPRSADGHYVTWINIEGLHETELISFVGSVYNLHPLLLEDVLNINQRPKPDSYGSYIYLVLKMLTCNDKNFRISAEQISFVLSDNLVITFQEGSRVT